MLFELVMWVKWAFVLFGDGLFTMDFDMFEFYGDNLVLIVHMQVLFVFLSF